MTARTMNWVGLAAGIATLTVVVVSIFFPWWQLTIGQNLVKIDASPIYTNFGLSGTQFTVPLIWVLNIITILTFTACGVIMLIYSLLPTKPYAKHLIGFAYRKPLWAVLTFIIVLIAIKLGAGYFGLNFPLTGSATITLPTNWTMGATVSTVATGNFQVSFYFAIAAAALCLSARIYHFHFAKAPIAIVPSAEAQTAPATTPTPA